jgi:APA family basic amino acid/polyamine antiporter
MLTWVPAVGSVAIFALWAYLGVEIITVPEEEIRDAKHTVPRAILISVFVVMAIYLLVAGVAIGLGRWENYLGAQAPLADMFRDATGKYIGNAGGALLALGVDLNHRVRERRHTGCWKDFVCDGKGQTAAEDPQPS